MHARKFRLKENLSASYLEKLSATCPGLKVLRLEECFIKGTNVRLKYLPHTIEKLSLAGWRNFSKTYASVFYRKNHVNKQEIKASNYVRVISY